MKKWIGVPEVNLWEERQIVIAAHELNPLGVPKCFCTWCVETNGCSDCGSWCFDDPESFNQHLEDCSDG